MARAAKDFLMMIVAGFLMSIGAWPPGQPLRKVMVQKCAGDHPNCWCRSAATCLLYRCCNCDMPIDETGKALFDDFWARSIDRHAGPCPMCGGPMRKP